MSRRAQIGACLRRALNKRKAHGSRRPPGCRSEQAGDPQYRAASQRRHGEAHPRCRHDRCGKREDHGNWSRKRRQCRRRHQHRRRQWHYRRARPDRQPCSPGRGRLDAAAKSDRLDRQLPAWRRHHDDFRGRGPHARPAARRRRPESDGDFRRNAPSGRCAPAA